MCCTFYQKNNLKKIIKNQTEKINDSIIEINIIIIIQLIFIL